MDNMATGWIVGVPSYNKGALDVTDLFLMEEYVRWWQKIMVVATLPMQVLIQAELALVAVTHCA